MEEKRREKRLPITLSLEILNLYKQDNVKVENLNAPIDVVNISKSGIGFCTKSILPIGYYFDANIKMGEDTTIHSVVEIVRSQLEGDTTIYGCEFVGMADVLSFIFEDYEQQVNAEE